MNYKYRLLLFPTLFFLGLILPQSVSLAATYYVDAYNRFAHDSNPGTEAWPWKTIGKATSLLRPGDTVFIKAGIYRETVILSKSGTNTKSIKIMAYPGDEGKAIRVPLNS